MKLLKAIIYAGAVFVIGSCYKDLSTEATTEIPEICIETESDIINVPYGHEIILSPQVSQKGRGDDDFEYFWEMDLVQGQKEDRIEIGTEKDLVYRVGNSPSDKPYCLTLTVTDKLTGLAKVKAWNVYVSSSLGEGVLVSTTKDSGKTCDLSLMCSKAITYGYTAQEGIVTSELYSVANGAPIQGRVNSLLTSVVTDGAVFNTTRVMVGTPDHIIALNPIDYKESERDGTLFNGKETDFNTTMLFNFGDYATCAVMNEQLFCCIGNFDRAYTRMPVVGSDTKLFFPRNIAYSKPSQGMVLLFNEKVSKFQWASILSVNGGMNSLENNGITLDINGAKALGGGCLKQGRLAMILKLANGKYALYCIDLSSMNPQFEEYQLLSVPDIDEADSFAFCDNANIIYYTAKNKIHVIVLSGNQVSHRVISWFANSSTEEITGIYHYAQAWYGTANSSFNENPFTLDTHRLQMMITTYDSQTKKSTVYFRPFSISTGLFLSKNNGFLCVDGEITAITTTTK